tara:strand:- start:326 stop:1009 length:684 start_codon:yes stop_codon:yes gene_type:complete
MNFYSIDTLYRQSAEWDVSWDEELECFIIDNYYEDPEAVYNHLQGRDIPLWKYNEERESPNGIDYVDARIVDKIGHPTRLHINAMERVLDICRIKWHKGHYEWRDDIEVNCFKTINIFDTDLQHYPHIDGDFSDADDEAVINMLVYLDKHDDGGTAVYENAWTPNMEHKGLLQPVETMMDLKHVIPAKFNRCVLFTGNKMHGAYINDYKKFVDDWRYSQVIFFFPKK